MEAFEEYIEDLVKQAKEEGKKHVAIQIAKRMIDIKMKDADILKVTHLTKKELEELKANNIDKILVKNYNDYNNVKGEKALSFEKFLSKNLYNKKLEGIKSGKIKIIKEMVKNQISDVNIIKVTRISEKELRHLKLQFMFMPSEKVPAPPSPNCTFDKVSSFPVFLKTSTCFSLFSTGEPCSITIGLIPF